MSSEVENENSNIEDSGDNDSQFIEIIDDVEIAEGSENNALYENCDIIDVPDEDEPEIAMNNSENGNFENQEESSGPCESTLQGVETSTALSQDGVAMYQKGFASPRYVLHMPSQGMSLQNTSTVFEPSAIGINVNLIPTTEYSSVENVQSSNISQGEIHTDLHSVSNTEPSNGPHCAENEEDLEVCYLAERPRTGMYTCTRTDLNTLCHPLVKSLVQEGEEFMQDVTKHFMQNLGHFGHVPKLVHKFLTAIVELDSVRQAKQDHLKQLKKKIFTPPNFSKFMEDVFKECDKQLQIEIALERNRSILTKSELFEVMLSNREKHFDLRNANQGANDASKRFVDQEAMTDGECELSPFTEEHFEVNSKERNQQMKKKMEKGVLHAKSYTWCKKCFQLATIHCCTQAEYCGEKCREADLACHASVCEKPRNL